MVSGSLRFDKDPVVWSAGEVPLSSHTAIVLTIYRQRWTHSNQAQYTSLPQFLLLLAMLQTQYTCTLCVRARCNNPILGAVGSIIG